MRSCNEQIVSILLIQNPTEQKNRMRFPAIYRAVPLLQLCDADHTAMLPHSINTNSLNPSVSLIVPQVSINTRAVFRRRRGRQTASGRGHHLFNNCVQFILRYFYDYWSTQCTQRAHNVNDVLRIVHVNDALLSTAGQKRDYRRKNHERNQSLREYAQRLPSN